MRDPTYRREFFHLPVLVSFWTAQWVLEIATIVCAAVYIDPFGSSKYYETLDMPFNYDSQTQLVRLLVIVLAVTSLCFRVFQVVVFTQHRLSPGHYFAIEFIQWSIWTVTISFTYCFVDVQFDGNKAVIIPAILAVTYTGSWIYSCVIFHRYWKWKKTLQEETERPDPLPKDRKPTVYKSGVSTSENAARDVETGPMPPAYEDIFDTSELQSQVQQE